MHVSPLFVQLLITIIHWIRTSQSTNSLSVLLSTKQKDGIIEGNPLLHPSCANALLSQHQSNLEYLNKSAIPNPWFWSREALDAVSKNLVMSRRTKLTFSNELHQSIPFSSLLSYQYAHNQRRGIPQHLVNWYSKLGHQIHTEIMEPMHFTHDDGFNINKYDNNTCFYHIEKSGSSSIAGMLLDYHFNISYSSENALFHCQCGFTFVRDPISRFVSGYYTINKLIYWYHHHLKRLGKSGPDMSAVPKAFSFWNITGEPQRMIEFINNMYDHSYEFTKTTPLEHMMTQTGLLAVAQVDLHYIGNVDRLMQHLEIIKNKCAIRTNNKFMLETKLEEKEIMTHFGTKWMEELRPWYTDMLSLDSYEAGDLDPAYLAIADNYDLYHKIVEFYKQDYICFGFEHDWIKFRNKIYNKLQRTVSRKRNARLNRTKNA